MTTKNGFPVRRTDTLTRGNLFLALAAVTDDTDRDSYLERLVEHVTGWDRGVFGDRKMRRLKERAARLLEAT